MQTYDSIVLGVGAVGSAALSALASRGVRVVGIERFEPGHDRGSSHGDTRAIRLAYFEHPGYVPLLRRALDAWRGLSGRASTVLFHECGILEAGPEGGKLIDGVLRSVREHDLELEEVDRRAMLQRFPGVRLPGDMRVVFEPQAGYLLVEECIRGMAREASEAGAELRTNTAVERWEEKDGVFLVHTRGETLRATSLVLAQGAWAAQAPATCDLPLTVQRKVQLWYRAKDNRYSRARGFVPFAMETPSGQVFYGFPELHGKGVKVAEHSGGSAITDPFTLDGQLHAGDRAPVEGFCAEFLPGLSDECLSHATCMYTRTPDGHFIVDQHPDHPRVAYAAGLSGHGFKFAPVLGAALADLALDGGTDLPIDFLHAGRLG